MAATLLHQSGATAPAGAAATRPLGFGGFVGSARLSQASSSPADVAADADESSEPARNVAAVSSAEATAGRPLRSSEGKAVGADSLSVQVRDFKLCTLNEGTMEMTRQLKRKSLK